MVSKQQQCATIESIGSHCLLALKVNISGSKITCMINSRATHSFICDELLNTATLQISREESLEVVLASSEKVIIERVC